MLNKILLLIISFTFLFASCSPIEDKVTKQEAIEFARKLQNQANVKSKDFIASSLSAEALVERMARIKPVKGKIAFVKGVKESLNKSKLAEKIYETAGEKGSIALVKVYEKNGTQRAIFRLFGSGLNYYDLEFTKINHEIKIADFFIYTSGENFSKTMTDLTNNVVGTEKQNEFILKVNNIKKSIAIKNYEEAYKQFNDLPTNIKNSKIIKILSLEIAEKISDSAYSKALEDLEFSFANEPNMYLVLIDAYFVKKEYSKALVAINKVDSLIDNDPFLDYYRGLTYKTSGDEKKAEKCFINLTQNMPEFLQSYDELISYYADKNDKENAIYYFKKYKEIKTADKSEIEAYQSIYPFLK